MNLAIGCPGPTPPMSVPYGDRLSRIHPSRCQYWTPSMTIGFLDPPPPYAMPAHCTPARSPWLARPSDTLRHTKEDLRTGHGGAQRTERPKSTANPLVPGTNGMERAEFCV
eukprot:2549038-Rhodomonas_salina.2